MPQTKPQPQPSFKVPVIWVLGGPGSGKGTQCEKIRNKYGFVHISTGELLRDEVHSGSLRGQRLGKIMNSGGLVPNDVVLELLKEDLLCNLCNAKGFLIDGYPREKEQGLLFERTIAPVTVVLLFETSEKTMLERLMHRAKSSGRSDDNELTMKKRIETFNKEKDLIMKQYENKIKRINADRSAEVIFQDVQRHLDHLLVVK